MHRTLSLLTISAKDQIPVRLDLDIDTQIKQEKILDLDIDTQIKQEQILDLDIDTQIKQEQILDLDIDTQDKARTNLRSRY